MEANKMLIGLAALCVFAAVEEVTAGKYSCQTEKDIIRKHLITNDNSKDVNGVFVNYWHLRWRMSQEKSSRHHKVVCPIKEFTKNDKEEIWEKLQVKTPEGKLVVQEDNQLKKTDHPGIFDSFGTMKRTSNPAGTSYSGNSMFFYSDSSVLGYVFCASHNQGKRVMFEVVVKQNKLAEAEAKTDNGAPNDVQKSLAKAKEKMIEIVNEYKSIKRPQDSQPTDTPIQPKDAPGNSEHSSTQPKDSSTLKNKDEISVVDKIQKFPQECYNIKLEN